jgi:hypothetical protein
MANFRKLQRRTALALLFGMVISQAGCVERRYTIRTDPPGALAIVNGEEIGQTPVSRSFVYHGDREITLMRDGYQTQTIIQPMKAPWWDNYLTEFFTENFLPYTLRDEHDYTYKLVPSTIPDRDNLMSRGQTLRSEAQTVPKPRRGGILGWLGF